MGRWGWSHVSAQACVRMHKHNLLGQIHLAGQWKVHETISELSAKMISSDSLPGNQVRGSLAIILNLRHWRQRKLIPSPHGFSCYFGMLTGGGSPHISNLCVNLMIAQNKISIQVWKWLMIYTKFNCSHKDSHFLWLRLFRIAPQPLSLCHWETYKFQIAMVK